jgi:RNA polymerase sigma-70 factor (ECF subfamily)
MHPEVRLGAGSAAAASIGAAAVAGGDFHGRAALVYADRGEARALSNRLTMDEAGLAELYRKYAPAIYAHCRRLLHSQQAARDATQEAFVRVLARGPAELAGEDALRYLYRVSTNVCLNQLRADKVHDRATPALVMRSTSGATAESGHADRQFAAALLDRCDETGAAIAIMHYIDGLSQVEVADTLGITRRTVFNRLRKLEKIAADLLATRVEAAAPAAEAARGEVDLSEGRHR